MGRRVLICGGRDPSRKVIGDVWAWVEANLSRGDVLIHGAANGVDVQASYAATSRVGCEIIGFPADWRKHGRAAGPIRNKQMLDEGKPDLVVAFSGGRGTANMVKQAREAGVDVIEVSDA